MPLPPLVHVNVLPLVLIPATAGIFPGLTYLVMIVDPAFVGVWVVNQYTLTGNIFRTVVQEV